MNSNRKACFDNAKRIVVKVGSGVLTADHGLNLDIINSISKQISALMDKNIEIILVSSGAMAAGVKKIGLAKRPNDIPKRQAVAAVGQAGVIMEYENSFEQYNKKVAQVLLTRDDLSHRRRYLNARNTLQTLLSWKILPIINENDTVMVEEIKFGDNDNLSSLITLLMDADILVNLTDIDGLYDKDPRNNLDAKLISQVTTISKNLEEIAGGIPGTLGTGGMLSKIRAARKVTTAGIPMIIAKGLEDDILLKLFSGQTLGTFFVPRKKKIPSRKCWIAFTLKSKGSLSIDDGAKDAILYRGKSLLPSGITSVEGDFTVGMPVECKNSDGEVIGTGLVNYKSSEIRKIMGLKSTEIEKQLGYKPYDYVIHRDNLVLTGESES